MSERWYVAMTTLGQGVATVEVKKMAALDPAPAPDDAEGKG